MVDGRQPDKGKIEYLNVMDGGNEDSQPAQENGRSVERRI
jgi:hypothetical protein